MGNESNYKSIEEWAAEKAATGDSAQNMEAPKAVDREASETSGEHHSDGEHHHHSDGGHHHHHSGEHHHHHHHSDGSSSGSSSEKSTSKSSEHHHHHHHHHHSDSSSSSKKPKKWYKDPKKRNKIVIIGSAIIIAILVVAMIIVAVRSRTNKSGANYCTYSIVENEVNFNGNKVDKIYVRYGEWDSVSENTADYKLRLTDSLSILYNGTYSGTILYKDGSSENFRFSYNDLAQPITLTERDGVIYIETNKNYRVNFLYYIYGQTLGDPYARYITLDPETESVIPLGKGLHTFRINATTSIGDIGTTTYYVAIDVKTCDKPTVLVQENSIGLFAYGFNISSVSYTKGEYNSWAEMSNLDTLYYAMCNSNLDRTDFEHGKYTFCFKSSTQDYIIHVDL